MTLKLRCVDCPADAPYRPATRPGPRCATHKRERRKGVSDARWQAHLLKTYKMTSEEYWRLYESQGRVCALCQRARGTTKRLSVDHDHKCCPETPACGQCNRGLLCGPCNKMLGHMRDDPMAFDRAATYLWNATRARVLRLGR